MCMSYVVLCVEQVGQLDICTKSYTDCSGIYDTITTKYLQMNVNMNRCVTRDPVAVKLVPELLVPNK